MDMILLLICPSSPFFSFDWFLPLAKKKKKNPSLIFLHSKFFYGTEGQKEVKTFFFFALFKCITLLNFFTPENKTKQNSALFILVSEAII